MDKKDVVHIYAPIKKNKTMPFAATWRQPAIIILRDVSRKRKTNTI